MPCRGSRLRRSFFLFSAMRGERREGLSCLTELAIKFPRTRRLVIADDDIEARLIGSLSPSPLDGVLSKSVNAGDFSSGTLFVIKWCTSGDRPTEQSVVH